MHCGRSEVWKSIFVISPSTSKSENTSTYNFTRLNRLTSEELFVISRNWQFVFSRDSMQFSGVRDSFSSRGGFRGFKFSSTFAHILCWLGFALENLFTRDTFSNFFSTIIAPLSLSFISHDYCQFFILDTKKHFSLMLSGNSYAPALLVRLMVSSKRSQQIECCLDSRV